MRKMTPAERRFFGALLLMQLSVVLVSGGGITYPIFVTAFCLYLILDLALAFTRANELLATTPRRFALIAVSLVLPVVIGMTIVQTKVLPEIRERESQHQVHASAHRASAMSTA
jgi:hypothetical protein